jgi:hypothetical protein
MPAQVHADPPGASLDPVVRVAADLSRTSPTARGRVKTTGGNALFFPGGFHCATRSISLASGTVSSTLEICSLFPVDPRASPVAFGTDGDGRNLPAPAAEPPSSVDCRKHIRCRIARSGQGENRNRIRRRDRTSTATAACITRIPDNHRSTSRPPAAAGSQGLTGRPVDASVSQAIFVCIVGQGR